MRTVITYGVGGYNPDLPNGNIVEQTVDNLDGTGTRTTYDADGNVTSVEQLTGLPIPVPPEPTAEERLATLLAALTDAQSLEEIRDAAAAAGGN
jgi:YD repeat-containing protein